MASNIKKSKSIANKIINNNVNQVLYQTIIKPILSTCTNGFYDKIDCVGSKIISNVLTDRKGEFVSFIIKNQELLREIDI